MKYYKVVKDGRTITDKHQFFEVFEGELFTEAEMNQKGIALYKDSKLFEEVDISKKKVYWNFGTRRSL